MIVSQFLPKSKSFPRCSASPASAAGRKSPVVLGGVCPARYCTSFSFTPYASRSVIAATRKECGASGPLLALGGTGLLPLRDTEDAHVLDTAIVGDTDILATADFKDFLTGGAEVLVPERLARFEHPKGRLLIAHPFTMRSWFLAGHIELPDLH